MYRHNQICSDLRTTLHYKAYVHVRSCDSMLIENDDLYVSHLRARKTRHTECIISCMEIFRFLLDLLCLTVVSSDRGSTGLNKYSFCMISRTQTQQAFQQNTIAELQKTPHDIVVEILAWQAQPFKILIKKLIRTHQSQYCSSSSQFRKQGEIQFVSQKLPVF